jgi:hypothetical protein
MFAVLDSTLVHDDRPYFQHWLQLIVQYSVSAVRF